MVDNLEQVMADLPPPQIIDEPSYQELYQKNLATFRALDPEYGLLLDSDPVVKLIQVYTYREFLLRRQINEAARAEFLAFATGTTLDHVAAFYDVVRADGETDDALRLRVVAAIKGRSPAGSRYYYRERALAADPRVADIGVFKDADSALVRISVLAADNNGVPDQALLDAVNAVVNDDAVRVLTDTVEVVPASLAPTDVTVNLYLMPNAPSDVVAALEQKLRDEFAANAKLGWDLTRSWITSVMHTADVYRVDVVTPATDVVVDGNQAVTLGTVTVTEAGRGY